MLNNRNASYYLVEVPDLDAIERQARSEVQTTPPLFDLYGRKAPDLLVEEEASSM